MNAQQKRDFAREERQGWTFVILITAFTLGLSFWSISARACEFGSIVSDFQNGWVRTSIQNTLWHEKDMAYKSFTSYDTKTGCYIESPVVFPLFGEPGARR